MNNYVNPENTHRSTAPQSHHDRAPINTEAMFEGKSIEEVEAFCKENKIRYYINSVDGIRQNIIITMEYDLNRHAFSVNQGIVTHVARG